MVKKYNLYDKDGSHEYVVTIEPFSFNNLVGDKISVYPSKNPEWVMPNDEPLEQILNTGSGIVFLQNKFKKNCEIDYCSIEYLQIALNMSNYPHNNDYKYKVVDQNDIKEI